MTKRYTRIAAGAALLVAAANLGYALSFLVVRPDNADTGGTAAPNQVDPRGLLTFGLGGLALLVFAPLVREANALPRSLAPLAATLGLLLVALYVLRLVVLDADNAAVVAVAALAGFVLSPLW